MFTGEFFPALSGKLMFIINLPEGKGEVSYEKNNDSCVFNGCFVSVLCR